MLNEQERINGLIGQLKESGAEAPQIIVVDGCPAGSTVAVINAQEVICLTAPAGRGNQLVTGVSVATGDVIMMLHADTLLPDNALQSIRAAVGRGACWGAFRLGINASGLAYRIIERFVYLRCKLFTLPYGDQAIFVTRIALQKIGGIPAIPLMEDVELALRLRRSGFRFALLPKRIVTSPRRWQKDGIIRRTLRNWWLLVCYLTGDTSEKLAQKY